MCSRGLFPSYLQKAEVKNQISHESTACVCVCVCGRERKNAADRSVGVSVQAAASRRAEGHRFGPPKGAQPGLHSFGVFNIGRLIEPAQFCAMQIARPAPLAG